MIDLAAAVERLQGEANPLGVVEVELAEARGRVLAEPLRSDRDFPGWE